MVDLERIRQAKSVNISVGNQYLIRVSTLVHVLSLCILCTHYRIGNYNNLVGRVMQYMAQDTGKWTSLHALRTLSAESIIL